MVVGYKSEHSVQPRAVAFPDVSAAHWGIMQEFGKVVLLDLSLVPGGGQTGQ